MKRESKTITVDLKTIIPEVWTGLWKANLATRAKYIAAGQTDRYWMRGLYYLTASDVEAGVRNYALAMLENDTFNYAEWKSKPWTSLRISTPGYRGGLNNAVRNWLLSEVRRGKLESHNFGRGHISGMRFRPKGEPVGPAEVATMEKKKEAKERDYKTNPLPVHGRLTEHSYNATPLCQYEPNRHSWRRNHRSPDSTLQLKAITCAACANLIAQPLNAKEEKQLEQFSKQRATSFIKDPEDRKLYKRLAKRKNAEKFGKMKGDGE